MKASPETMMACRLVCEVEKAAKASVELDKAALFSGLNDMIPDDGITDATLYDKTIVWIEKRALSALSDQLGTEGYDKGVRSYSTWLKNLVIPVFEEYIDTLEEI